MKWRCLLGLIVIGASVGPAAFGQAALTILGNPTINIQTAADRQNGMTISQETVDITGQNGRTITFQVRASGNLISGANSIPLSTLFMQIISPSGLTGGEIQVSTANQTLLTKKLTGSLSKQPLLIQYRLAPSAALSGPVGAYTTTLTFTISQL